MDLKILLTLLMFFSGCVTKATPNYYDCDRMLFCEMAWQGRSIQLLIDHQCTEPDYFEYKNEWIEAFYDGDSRIDLAKPRWCDWMGAPNEDFDLGLQIRVICLVG